eukprot:scaffold54732_cov59-Phaeocystis_antarctica.AAC.4
MAPDMASGVMPSWTSLLRGPMGLSAARAHVSYFISRSIHVPLLRARDSRGAALATWRLPARMAERRCIGSMSGRRVEGLREPARLVLAEVAERLGGKAAGRSNFCC